MLRQASMRLLAVIALFACVTATLVGQPGGKGGVKGGGAKAPKGAPTGLVYFAPTNQMLAIEEIVKDLKLDAKQQEAVRKALADFQDAIKAPPPAGKKGFGGFNANEQQALLKFNAAIAPVLGEKMKRLDQIAAQGAGLPAFFTPARQEKLGLTEDQLAKGRDITAAAYKDILDKAAKDGGRLSLVGPKGAELRTAYVDKATIDLLQLLTKEQNKRWLEIVGEPLQPDVLLKVRTGSTSPFTGPGFGDWGTAKGTKKVPATAAARITSSWTMFRSGHYDDAADMARKALELAKDANPQRGEALVVLGASLCKLGKADDAEPLLNEALTVYQKDLGPYNPRIADALTWLGNCAERRGKLDEAEKFQRKALDLNEKVAGSNSKEAAANWNNLGKVLHRQKKLDEAEKLLRQSLDIHEKSVGKDNVATAVVANNLAAVCRDQGKAKEAEDLATRALDIYTQNNHPDAVAPLRMLTDLCIQQKRWNDAETHIRAWLRAVEKAKTDTPALLEPLDRLATVLSATGRADEAAGVNQRKQGLKDRLAAQKAPATP
jgi:tetratricopeptide (TPR) repeat protein